MQDLPPPTAVAGLAVAGARLVLLGAPEVAPGLGGERAGDAERQARALLELLELLRAHLRTLGVGEARPAAAAGENGDLARELASSDGVALPAHPLGEELLASRLGATALLALLHPVAPRITFRIHQTDHRATLLRVFAV